MEKVYLRIVQIRENVHIYQFHSLPTRMNDQPTSVVACLVFLVQEDLELRRYHFEMGIEFGYF